MKIRSTKFSGLKIILSKSFKDYRGFFKENFKKKFTSINSKYRIYFMESSKNNIFFNMRGLLEQQLRDLSVNHIFHVNNDTYSESDLFFSHRRSTQKEALPTGRMINIIGFKQ